MAKQTAKNSDVAGKVYREFSRQRNEHYRSRFPRMKESEIISKVIADWEAMNPSARTNLQKDYVERKFISLSSSSKSAGSKGQKKTRKIKTPQEMRRKRE